MLCMITTEEENLHCCSNRRIALYFLVVTATERYREGILWYICYFPKIFSILETVIPLMCNQRILSKALEGTAVVM